MKKEVAKKNSLQPMPKVVVSCRDNKGNENALVVAYCGNCSYDPPMLMVGIVPSRHSYNMIKESGCMVVNIPTKDFVKEYEYLGSVSGRDEDKLNKMNIKRVDGDIVKAPLLSDCPVNIELSIVDSIITGSHEMFACKVEKVHASAEISDDKGIIDWSKLEII